MTDIREAILKAKVGTIVVLEEPLAVGIGSTDKLAIEIINFISQRIDDDTTIMAMLQALHDAEFWLQIFAAMAKERRTHNDKPTD